MFAFRTAKKIDLPSEQACQELVAGLDETVNETLISNMYKELFGMFRYSAKHGDEVAELLKEGVTSKGLFATHFVRDPTSPGYVEFLAYCTEQGCAESMLWFACFKELEQNVRKPKKFVQVFNRGYTEYLRVESINSVNIGNGERFRIEELTVKNLGYVPMRDISRVRGQTTIQPRAPRPRPEEYKEEEE